ncbi:UDP-N-acetylmuramate:L-alanyl-gamma-D-glutamyl-meso-diaminopimelate ligase [Sutterella sp.]|uniref:UDP-N-acetylmuramate:L-alanyl-gamma-D-glutamyl- meso-diaminopimelate ligase n=1 Tax=Sutterella sp. TaxID=1981025 RepID=UPI0026DF8FD9|nr:UDP-N-acetylmuramate:L-alanyl-gamma-D-glutamyl-meso-diaminopimelate ligase [Sutterella sp.]MDO5531842.1 UDP-N-acetylmuramate:L-alanyl-gamma-D-glutamyl-meso-diaminopimelate ligase [Sutterella sp.]
MHIHILGICGTFMGGVAQLARAAGHRVSGCDLNVYPPMSTALAANGIEIIKGWGAEQIDLKPDLWVVGNAVSRGNPLIEAILNAGLPYISGPQWMSENILQGRPVLAVAGTHGKTTTTSMLTWILKEAGLNPGFLIGGVPRWGDKTAELGDPKAPFVIEADEYDTAFCDKRSKFVHYRPRVAILNNLEYDHADIFPSLEAIEIQFHHLVRTIPSEGTIIANAKSPALDRALARGCWSRLERFDAEPGTPAGWTLSEDGTASFEGKEIGKIEIGMPGRYNELNALAAVAAARAIGVDPQKSLAALATFPGVRRRQEVRGEADGCTVIDDFAHHPTAIRETLGAVKAKYPGRRILAILEPRTSTMKLGTMKGELAGALAAADEVFCYAGAGVRWEPGEALAALGPKARVTHDFEVLMKDILAEAKPGDVLLCMSNGGFGGIHGRLLEGLKARE